MENEKEEELEMSEKYPYSADVLEVVLEGICCRSELVPRYPLHDIVNNLLTCFVERSKKNEI